MMRLDDVALFDIASTAGFSVSMYYAYRLMRSFIDDVSKRLLIACMGIYFLVGVSNVLQHAGITAYFDAFEDYLEILFIPMFIFFIYSTNIYGNLRSKEISETAVKQSEATMRSLFEAIPDMIFKLSSKGMFVFFKPAKDFPPLFPPAQFIGKNVTEILPEAIANKALESIKIALATGLTQHFDSRLIVASGEERVFDARISSIGSDEVLVVIRDITEHRMLEDQLMQAQKMEALGTLTGGIAHEFNNILTAIMGYGELLAIAIPEDDPNRKSVDFINLSAERAADITRGLLAYTRKQITHMNPLDIKLALSAVGSYIGAAVGENIKMTIFVPVKPLVVFADKTQIEQVIMNLATNAIDAMPDGGNLDIKAELAELPSDMITPQTTVPAGRYALITVADTGHGMDEQTLARVFEPFYTTKDVGKGTGLGLPMVSGIISKHNGFVTVESSLQKGAKFSVYLPLIEGKEIETPGKIAGVEHTGIGTILLAEDNGDVRRIVATVLASAGYDVLHASNGIEAVEIFKAHSSEIDLMLFDIAMPRKNGDIAFDEIKAISPKAKCIFMSGYVPGDVKLKSVEKAGISIIHKPIKQKELLQIIAEKMKE